MPFARKGAAGLTKRLDVRVAAAENGSEHAEARDLGRAQRDRLPQKRPMFREVVAGRRRASHVRDVALLGDRLHSYEDALTQWLTDRDVLLVLDNCEHVVAAVADLVDALTARLPRLRVLATSREPHTDPPLYHQAMDRLGDIHSGSRGGCDPHPYNRFPSQIAEIADDLLIEGNV